MKKGLSIIVVILLCCVFPDICHGADTIKINLTYKHKLNEKGQTQGSMTIRQEFYTQSNELFRVINYDASSGSILNYTFLFYKNNKLYTEECYNMKDSLLYILRHDYDANGNDILITRFVPKGKNIIESGKTRHTYGPEHRLISSTVYFGKKAGTTTQYKYDSNGKLIREKTTHKPIANAPYKQETKIYSHKDDGTLDKLSLSITDLSGRNHSYTEIYSIANGKVISVKKMNPDGTISLEKVFHYLASGAPSIYEEHNSQGIIILLIEYDYRKHYMDKGTQISFYESL